MIRLITTLCVLMSVSACRSDVPGQIGFSMANLPSSPVLATKVVIGSTMALSRDVVVYGTGYGDPEVPRSLSLSFLNWNATSDQITVEAEWVELRTNRAYRATEVVALSDLQRSSSDAALIVLVFGPHGQLIIGSDGVPPDGVPRDLAQTCGIRQPQADRVVAAEVNAIAQLSRALSLDHPPVPAETYCPDPAS